MGISQCLLNLCYWSFSLVPASQFRKFPKDILSFCEEKSYNSPALKINLFPTTKLEKFLSRNLARSHVIFNINPILFLFQEQ